MPLHETEPAFPDSLRDLDLCKGAMDTEASSGRARNHLCRGGPVSAPEQQQQLAGDASLTGAADAAPRLLRRAGEPSKAPHQRLAPLHG